MPPAKFGLKMEIFKDIISNKEQLVFKSLEFPKSDVSPVKT